MKFILGIILFASLSQAVPAFAECKQTYIVGVLTDSPYYAKNPRLPAKGLVKDLLEALKKNMGCTFQEIPVNYVRALEDFKALRLDLFAFSYVNPAWLDVTDHVVLYSSERVLLVNKKNVKPGGKISDYIADRKIKFGNLIGTAMFIQPEEMEKFKKENRIVQSSSADGVIGLLATGRAQAVFLTPIYLRFLQSNKELMGKFEVLNDSEAQIDIGLYVSKKRVSSEESSQIRKAVETMKKDGTIKEILGKYLTADELKRYK